MIDSSIALGVRPATFDTGGVVNMVAQAQARRMAQETHQQNMELNAQKIEEGKAAVQQSNQKAADQKITLAAFQRANGDPKATVQYAIEAGASPEAILTLQKHDADQQEKYAKIESDRLPVRKYQNEQMLGLHGQALSMDPETLAQNWPQIYAQAVKIDPEAAKHLDPNAPPTPDQLKLSQSGYATDAYYLTQAEEKRKQAEEKRASMLAGPQLDKATAEAAAANRQQDASTLANALKQGPQAFAAAMAQIPPARRAPFSAVTAQAKPEDILALGMTPDQQVTTAETAKRDEATRVNEAAMREQGAGRLKVEQGREQRERDVYNQNYGPGANSALQGVLPAQRNGALSAAQKAADEFTKAMESTANVQTFIDMAKKGNKAAGSNLPIMGAESIQALNGIRRINRTEIEQYQGAGSLLDKINGRIGKLISGQPIPADVMKDIEALHKAISGNAAANYSAKLDGINQNFHSNFKPVKGTEAAQPATSGGHVIEVGGKHYRYNGSGATDDMKNYTEVK